MQDSERGVLIVGGTSGVGLATARQMAAAGYRKIVLAGRNAERGASALEEVRATAPDADVSFVSVDARNLGGVQSMVAEAEARLGGIEVVVNSTSTGYAPELFFRTPAEDMAPLLSDLLFAPMNVCRAVIDTMRSRKSGVIVNVASDAAKIPTPGETVIGAAMAAIVMFSRTLALEARRDGIRVHALTPSLIKGTESEKTAMSTEFGAKLFAQAASQAHLGVAEPNDIAATIVFLASDGAARMTGQVISVNGGISVA